MGRNALSAGLSSIKGTKKQAPVRPYVEERRVSSRAQREATTGIGGVATTGTVRTAGSTSATAQSDLQTALDRALSVKLPNTGDGVVRKVDTSAASLRKEEPKKTEPKPTSSNRCKTEFSKDELIGIRNYISNPSFAWDVVNAIDGIAVTEDLIRTIELIAAKCPEIRGLLSKEEWQIKARAYGKTSDKWYPASKENQYYDDGNEDEFVLQWIWASSRGFERLATEDEIKAHKEKLRQQAVAAAKQRRAQASGGNGAGAGN